MIATDRLHGSMPPLVTPFRNGHVDEEAYGRLLEYQAANGSHGVVVNGTSGEPSTLSVAERNRLVDDANEHRLAMVPATPGLEARLDAILERTGLVARESAASAGARPVS